MTTCFASGHLLAGASGEDFRPSRRSSLRTHRWSGRTPLRSERRFEAATGNPAVLVETGETFEALATQGAGTGVGLRPAPAVADVANEEREAATGQARACLHCGGQRFESPQLHQNF
jgi:hypothetical protein